MWASIQEIEPHLHYLLHLDLDMMENHVYDLSINQHNFIHHTFIKHMLCGSRLTISTTFKFQSVTRFIHPTNLLAQTQCSIQLHFGAYPIDCMTYNFHIIKTKVLNICMFPSLRLSMCTCHWQKTFMVQQPVYFSVCIRGLQCSQCVPPLLQYCPKIVLKFQNV